MHRILVLSFFLALATIIPLADALAQSSPGRGAVGGAIIGGAIGGRRGAAVGAIAGAASGSRRRWHNQYYWRHGRCWVRTHSGSHPVASRYCR
jgi:Glycine zipper